MTDTTLDGWRSKRGALAGLAFGALLVAISISSPVAAESPGGDVWITLGADAFDTLVSAGDLRSGGLPLQRFAESSGVVLTRVDRRDFDRISIRLHTAHRRCGTFVAHRSLEEAFNALAALDRLPTTDATAAFTIDQGSVVQQLQDAVAEPPMLASILALSTDFNNRYYIHPSGVAAALWIRDLWQGYALGRPDVSVELFDHPDWAQPSVILTIAGADLPDEIVILGGHLDSTVSGSTSNPDFIAPGADDNASGIAVLSEVIRVAMSENFRPQRTVQFMAYAAEEVGIAGSLEIAGTYQQAGVNVSAVLQLDMTGYNGSTEDVALLSDYVDPALTAFIGDLLDTYQPELLWTSTSCGYPCSDHAAWTLAGYDAAMSFEARFGEHNPWIHTDQDTLDTLGNSVAHAAKFARLAAGFMAEAAKSADVVIFTDGFESGTTGAWSMVVP